LRAIVQFAFTLFALLPIVSGAAAQELSGNPVETPLTTADSTPIPKTAEQYHEEGVKLLHEHRPDAALEELRQAVELDDKSALFITDLGYAYLTQERYLEAEVAFKKGIVLDPSRPHAYEHLVESVIRQPQRWDKRSELSSILEQGISNIKNPKLRLRLEIARIRFERTFGLAERARGHIDELLRGPNISRTLEKQIRELKASLEQDEKARALRDWPEPEVDANERVRLSECAKMAESQSKKEALACLALLSSKYPAWRAPRRIRATVLAEQGHYDEAVKELTILVRLEPSEPHFHRDLGLLLADHGGLLELERADEELRIACALEPEWSELEPVRKKLAARRYDSVTKTPSEKRWVAVPTENAQRLYEKAESSLEEDPDHPSIAKALVEQALRESPSFIEAAVLWVTLSRRAPESTVNAFWQEGDRLFSLYQECARIEPPLPRQMIEPWLNRAIELGHVEGRLTRALNFKNRGEKAAAEIELSNYLALVSNREEVEAVQLLRSEIQEKTKPGPGRDTILNARLRLQNDDTEGALHLLDAPCRIDMDSERLFLLGVVYERQKKNELALGCYEFELARGKMSDWTERAKRRFVRLLARCEPSLLKGQAASRLPQLASVDPAAYWALARRAFDGGKTEDAKTYVATYLAHAIANDRFVPEAQVLKQRLIANEQLWQQGQQKRRRFLSASASGVLALLGGLIYWFFFRGDTVAKAVQKKPRIFPELSRILGELRHDVLKHRTSALELVLHDRDALPKLKSTLLEPIPTSTVVAEAYARLEVVARAEGLVLRRLLREPTFGSLAKDLKLVERELCGRANEKTLKNLDERLRGVHRERINQLIALGPRYQLDASVLQQWISALQAEFVSKDLPWTVPALQMSDLVFLFPIDQGGLFQIFSNLLRNAEVAVQGESNPKVLVRLHRDIDFSGRTLAKLQFVDNAKGELSLQTFELQAKGRGLSIVWETVRDWNGHVVIGEEVEPYRKSVGVEFAL
jgi:Flp pilus assembly protein TadD